jgi:hypothetical protein
VDRDVHTPIQESQFERRDEGPFAPRSIWRSPVAIGLDDHDMAGLAGAMELVEDEIGLDEGQLAAPGSDRDC